AMVVFTILVLGLVCKICGFNIFTLLRILKEELIIAFSTASSETALPKIIEKMEAYGAPKSVTSFVIPTGYSFNLDGSTLYQSITVIFLAQLFGMDLSLTKQLIIVITLMIASKGIAGVPGASILVLSATLGSVGIPLEGIGYIMGVERILDMGRTAVNVIGNALAAIVIARWEHVFDDKKARAYEVKFLGNTSN
ncbi:MAG: cation:dicarboxylase symporter family transporter, partial [Candidatus Schmidhempelia sp.]|nr:cation:dicarboxylase symporter family transporter [Candidatus Schmidhempelia sp.]